MAQRVHSSANKVSQRTNCWWQSGNEMGVNERTPLTEAGPKDPSSLAKLLALTGIFSKLHRSHRLICISILMMACQFGINPLGMYFIGHVKCASIQVCSRACLCKSVVGHGHVYGRSSHPASSQGAAACGIYIQSLHNLKFFLFCFVSGDLWERDTGFFPPPPPCLSHGRAGLRMFVEVDGI